ncbi:arsinothricin resistance N-acetyltransferase ArsN1 family B [Rudaea sp.]|uniref:arsinothricin resistance N-acetyltransferase ArsN1 family B n=1 Tax=Rudaea sp. TaxID=2136325 RepID=UPI002ED67DF0
MNAAVTLRVASEADAAAIRDIYAPHVEHAAVSFETEVPSVEAMAARIAKLLPTHPWLVAVVDDHVAGYAYAGPHRERAAYRWSVEVTAYVRQRFHARGIGRRLYAALHAVLKAQNYVNAYGIITLPNAASIALHEACGFRPCALFRHAGYKFGAWHDVGWWQLQIGEPVSIPVEPIAFAQLDDKTITQALGND